MKRAYITPRTHVQNIVLEQMISTSVMSLSIIDGEAEEQDEVFAREQGFGTFEW